MSGESSPTRTVINMTTPLQRMQAFRSEFTNWMPFIRRSVHATDVHLEWSRAGYGNLWFEVVVTLADGNVYRKRFTQEHMTAKGCRGCIAASAVVKDILIRKGII